MYFMYSEFVDEYTYNLSTNSLNRKIHNFPFKWAAVIFYILRPSSNIFPGKTLSFSIPILQGHGKLSGGKKYKAHRKSPVLPTSLQIPYFI